MICGITYQGSDDKRYTEPRPVLKKSEDVCACQEGKDNSSDRSAGDGGRIRPEHICRLRCVRHGQPERNWGFEACLYKLWLGVDVYDLVLL